MLGLALVLGLRICPPTGMSIGGGGGLRKITCKQSVLSEHEKPVSHTINSPIVTCALKYEGKKKNHPSNYRVAENL